MGSTFRKGSEQSGQSGGMSNEMAGIARNLMLESGPMRQQAMGQLGGFLGLPVFDEQSYLMANPDVASAVNRGLIGSGRAHFESAGRGEGRKGTYLPGQAGRLPEALTGDLATQEQELAAAKRSILDNTQRGGLQQMALAELPLQRLGMRDALRSQVFNTALGTALGQAPIAMQGLGNAASNLNTLGAQRIQQNMAFQQGLGGLVGLGLTKGR